MKGPKWPFLLILFICGPCVVILNCLGQVLYLGRAPRTKETLLDFREWCRVTRHPRVFRGLTGCQRTPGIGASHYMPMNAIMSIHIFNSHGSYAIIFHIILTIMLTHQFSMHQQSHSPHIRHAIHIKQ